LLTVASSYGARHGGTTGFVGWVSAPGQGYITSRKLSMLHMCHGEKSF